MKRAPRSIPWYQSHVLHGLAITVVAGILGRFHITQKFAPDASQIVDTLFDIISLAGAAYSAYSRVAKPMPRVTRTKAQALRINRRKGK
jgi:hypothetical protein